MCIDKCVEISIPFECKMGCFLLVDLGGDFQGLECVMDVFIGVFVISLWKEVKIVPVHCSLC